MASPIVCKVHPVVFLTIVDAYERREIKEGSNTKAIGTLLGYHDKGSVEVTNCYCVPHSELNEEAKISTQINKDMYDLNKAANSTESAIGWFSTNAEINEKSLMYHDFYQDFVKSVSTNSAREQPAPVVHLIVDTSLTNGRMGMKAYIVQKIKLPKNDSPQCAIFVPVDVEIVAFEPEKVGVSLVSAPIFSDSKDKRGGMKIVSGMKQLDKSTDQMLIWIDKLKRYVDDVINKKRPGDVNIGRKLNDLVTSVTHLQPGQFETMLNTGMKDFLMVAYLAELAKTELKLYEKLTSV